jgi:hypothetical protein
MIILFDVINIAVCTRMPAVTMASKTYYPRARDVTSADLDQWAHPFDLIRVCTVRYSISNFTKDFAKMNYE